MLKNGQQGGDLKEKIMRLTKRQLKRIIREEYSRLKRQGLIHESSSYLSNTGHHHSGPAYDGQMEAHMFDELQEELYNMGFDTSSMKLEDDGEEFVSFGFVQNPDFQASDAGRMSRDLGKWYITYDRSNDAFFASNDSAENNEVYGSDAAELAYALEDACSYESSRR